MTDRWTRLAQLAVHGANIQPGQIVMVTGEIGQEEMARAVAAAAYDCGAKFVDVDYFDPWIKRARVEHAAKKAGRDLRVPFTPGRTDAAQEDTDVRRLRANFTFIGGKRPGVAFRSKGYSSW